MQSVTEGTSSVAFSTRKRQRKTSPRASKRQHVLPSNSKIQLLDFEAGITVNKPLQKGAAAGKSIFAHAFVSPNFCLEPFNILYQHFGKTTGILNKTLRRKCIPWDVSVETCVLEHSFVLPCHDHAVSNRGHTNCAAPNR